MSQSMPGQPTPAAEVAIDAALVRRLLEANGIEADYRNVTLLDEGWDNAIYRLDPDPAIDAPLSQQLLIRLPRRECAVELLQVEQHWLPRLPALPIPIPIPIIAGTAAAGYPWPFSVLPWIPGQASDLAPADASEAPRYAEFLAALHQSAPNDAPFNPVRGIPLKERAPYFKDRWDRSAPADPEERALLENLWHTALNAPEASDRVWLHGDPHARNMLVEQGRISGVIDWGDMCGGDRANDLSGFWMHFPDHKARHLAMARYTELHPHTGTATWLRARAWALNFALVLIDTGKVDHPRHLRMGQRTQAALLDDLRRSDAP